MTRFDARRIFANGKCAVRWLACSALLLCCGFLSAPVYAQTPDAGPILGQIIGDDISVTGPSQAAANSPVPAIEFSGGSTIVVHSGKARVDLVGGGELDICGPAKFSVLSSGEALTIALSFGRVHLRVDAQRPIVIYSPLVLATPVPIGDRERDATIGLTNNGAMCVLASSGAVRLQNQLSGETVIVPQPAEVLVPGASFAYLPRARGQCRCEFDESSASLAAPTAPVVNSANATTPQTSKQPAPASSTPNSVSSARQEAPSQPQPPNAPAVPKNVPASAPPPSSSSPATPTVTAQPPLKIILPPIGYDVKSSTETAEPLSVATLMLAQEAVVQPEWTFHGTVISSPGAAHGTAQSAASANSQASPNPAQPKKGFWAKLRTFIIGSGSH